MFAKALWPTDPITVPLLLLTAPRELVEQLHGRGWAPFAGDVIEADAQVDISTDGLTLTVDKQSMMSGLNPTAPPGWWEAVDALEQHAMVVVLPEETDLTSEGLLGVLNGLRDDARSAQALARIAA